MAKRLAGMHKAISILLHMFMAAPSSEEVRLRTFLWDGSRSWATRVGGVLRTTPALYGFDQSPRSYP
jgi:hypothetical protein